MINPKIIKEHSGKIIKMSFLDIFIYIFFAKELNTSPRSIKFLKSFPLGYPGENKIFWNLFLFLMKLNNSLRVINECLLIRISIKSEIDSLAKLRNACFLIGICNEKRDSLAQLRNEGF